MDEDRYCGEVLKISSIEELNRIANTGMDTIMRDLAKDKKMKMITSIDIEVGIEYDPKTLKIESINYNGMDLKRIMREDQIAEIQIDLARKVRNQQADNLWC